MVPNNSERKGLGTVVDLNGMEALGTAGILQNPFSPPSHGQARCHQWAKRLASRDMEIHGSRILQQSPCCAFAGFVELLGGGS